MEETSAIGLDVATQVLRVHGLMLMVRLSSGAVRVVLDGIAETRDAHDDNPRTDEAG
jgi:hypothetical protein